MIFVPFQKGVFCVFFGGFLFMNIYVGNLNFKTTEDEVKQLFEQYGSVTSVKLITDRDTGRPRGFGFVEMEDEGAGDTAVESLNGTEYAGRNLKVNVAKEKREQRNGGGNFRGNYNRNY
jgi:RNA recognition motif-containing protein